MKTAAATVVLALALPISTGTAQPVGKRPPPKCPTGLLITYHVGDGRTFSDDLVIGAGGHAWLCWGRHLSNTSGETIFTVAGSKLAVLEQELSRIGIQHLGALRQQPCCDRPTASLVYQGRAIPDDGYPESEARILALRSAEAILNGIIKQRSPDHQTVRVIQPLA